MNMRKELTLDALLSDLVDFKEGRSIQDIDFTIECNPSLKTTSIYNVRGKKIRTVYDNRDTGETVVLKEFIEDYDGKNLKIIFKWFDRDGEVFASKEKIIDMHDEGQWQSRYRNQRERIMDDLKGRASKYGASHYVDILYDYFKEEKQNFVETGSLNFSQAVKDTLVIDISTVSQDLQDTVGTVLSILNTSLDGENKVYETLIHLTTL